MLTPVERVLILRNIDLLKGVGPRQLFRLASLAREVPMWKGQLVYQETDAADALYVIAQGSVRLSAEGAPLSELKEGEAFGTWALVDDAARGQRAEALSDGLLVALDRDDFYEFAAGDVQLLKDVITSLARRLRELVAAKPEEARVEGEGAEEPAPASEAAPASEKKSP
jgi:CRP-like cAMP-binding protein